jgi:membrane protein YdbS with pleckstrin-like domain
MASARYLLPQHPTLSGPHTKEELYVLVERGSLARGEIVMDRVTKRSHKVGELIGGMPPPRLHEPGGRLDRPAYQEFAGDTPWEAPRSKEADPAPEAESEDGEDEDEEPAIDEEPLDEELEGEEIHFRGHPSWFSVLPALLLVLVLLAASVMSIPFGGKYFLLGLALASLTFCCAVMTRQLNEYYVTTERVEMDWGLIGRSSKEIRIVDIRAIDVRQGGFIGFFGVGTVDFSSSGSAAVEVQFKNVRRPHRIKELVRQLQRRAGAGGA